MYDESSDSSFTNIESSTIFLASNDTTNENYNNGTGEIGNEEEYEKFLSHSRSIFGNSSIRSTNKSTMVSKSQASTTARYKTTNSFDQRKTTLIRSGAIEKVLGLLLNALPKKNNGKIIKFDFVF